jgi:hypothetical protein
MFISIEPHWRVHKILCLKLGYFTYFEFTAAYSDVQGKTVWGLPLCVDLCTHVHAHLYLRVKCKIVYPPQKKKTVGKLNLKFHSLKGKQNTVSWIITCIYWFVYFFGMWLLVFQSDLLCAFEEVSQIGRGNKNRSWKIKSCRGTDFRKLAEVWNSKWTWDFITVGT